MKKLIKFDDNLRLAIQYIPTVRSVSCGVFVGTGSGSETPENNGVSHFLEHMCFKGTSDMTAFDIVEKIDNIGGQINAFTSKQMTVYYTVSTDEHIETALSVLSGITTDSQLLPKELAKEKGVIKEEIDMNDDTPEDVAVDCVSESFFKEHPLGMTILGAKNNIKNMTSEDLVKYYKDNYTSGNIVISIAGNVTVEKAKALTEKYFVGKFKKSEIAKKYEVIHKPTSGIITREKQIEQANICLAFNGFDYFDKMNYANTLLNLVWGSGMSSRLFQKIREELGLVYNIYSYPSAYFSNGMFNIYLATNYESVEKALTEISNEITLLKEKGITEKEFLRGREVIKGNFIIGQESTVSIMRSIGRYALFNNEMFELDEYLDNYNKLTMKDIDSAVEALFDRKTVNVGYVGKKIDVDMLSILKAE